VGTNLKEETKRILEEHDKKSSTLVQTITDTA